MFQRTVYAVGAAICLLLMVSGTSARDLQEEGQAPPIWDQPDYQAIGSPDSIYDPIIPWPLAYGVQQTEEINARFDCRGTFGNFGGTLGPDYGWPQVRFETPSGSNTRYLYAGAIWIGGIIGTDTLVSVGADGWTSGYELWAPGSSVDDLSESVTNFEYISDFAMRAEFNDTLIEGIAYDEVSHRPHIPLNLSIANRSHVWRTDPYDGTVIYDMVLTNMGDDPIEAGYVGLYMDADIHSIANPYGGAQDDITGSLRNQGIGYAIDNDGELHQPPDEAVPKVFAFEFLDQSFVPSDTNFNWWISNGDPSHDFGPRHKDRPGDPYRQFEHGGTGTPSGDGNKYYILSHDEWDYDQFRIASIDSTDTLWMYPPQNSAVEWSWGMDTRFLMSIGPFDLMPDSSIRVLYATFTGEDVHTDPDNLNNLPADPDAYLAGLGFVDMLANAALSHELADSLLDPTLPTIGLQVEYQDVDSAVIEWDPWVFDDVVGYEIYLSEIDPGTLPYPGLPAPWLEPSSYDLEASVGRTYRHSIAGLDPHKMYFVNVAHNLGRATGDPGKPLLLTPHDRNSAPLFDIEYTFIQPSDPVNLEWTAPDGVDVDHYNIYKFAVADSMAPIYHPFYDNGYTSIYNPSIPAKDSFLIDDIWYFYYAMDVHQQIDSQFTSYTDYDVEEGATYLVTAIDKHGFESHFSIEVEVLVVEPPSKDVLFVSKWTPGSYFVTEETLLDFYDYALGGYDYDLYQVWDTLSVYGCTASESGCVDWRDFAKYSMVVLDDDILEHGILRQDELVEKTLTKYLLTGGKLVYFGGLGIFLTQSMGTEPDFYPTDEWEFTSRFFGVDSVFYVGPMWGSIGGDPVDSLYGMLSASTVSGDPPSISYDLDQYPFTPMLLEYWPATSAPTVSVFRTNPDGVTTHLFEGIPGGTCLLDSEPVGVHTVTDEAETWLFGFHLWYMDKIEARALFRSLLGFGCCQNYRGNINNDPSDQINISDLTYLVAYLFQYGPRPPCLEEANINADPEEKINVADITYLVHYMFSGGPPPPDCPE